MKRISLLLPLVAALALACAASTTPSSNVATASISPTPIVTPIPSASWTVSPTPTPIPIRSWDVAPKTGVAHLDAIIAAIYARDSATLARYVTGSPSRCPVRGAMCPDGSPLGTPMRVFGRGSACESQTLRLDDAPGRPGEAVTRTEVADLIAGGPFYVDRIIGVWTARPGTDAPAQYVVIAIQGLVFDRAARPVNGRQLFLDEAGFTALLPGIGCNPPVELADYTDRYDVLIAPPR